MQKFFTHLESTVVFVIPCHTFTNFSPFFSRNTSKEYKKVTVCRHTKYKALLINDAKRNSKIDGMGPFNTQSCFKAEI